MPNYVSNCLSFNGKENVIKSIIHDLHGKDTILDFNKILPTPNLNNQEQVLSWKTHHWGCKWNAMDIELDLYTYYFLTPWNPPIPVIKILSEKYPNIEIILEWAEETGADSGAISFKNGHEVWSSYYEEGKNNEYYEKLWGIDCIE